MRYPLTWQRRRSRNRVVMRNWPPPSCRSVGPEFGPSLLRRNSRGTTVLLMRSAGRRRDCAMDARLMHPATGERMVRLQPDASAAPLKRPARA